MLKQDTLDEAVNRVETVLMDGFRHEAKNVLSGKLGKDEAKVLLEKKYDVETALVIESSITDCIMKVSEMESEMVGATYSLIMF